MANRAAQSRVIGVRPNAQGTGHLLGLRVRLEAGDTGHLAPGWYVVTVPIQNIRAWETGDEPVSQQEMMSDDSRQEHERLEELHRSIPPPGEGSDVSPPPPSKGSQFRPV
jgi:hypothetical protein